MKATQVRCAALVYVFAFSTWFVGACAGSKAATPATQHPSAKTLEEPAPTGRLPADQARPLAYTLELTVLPKQDRFSGRTQIAVELPVARDRIWLHGKDLHVTSVQAQVAGQRVAGTYRQVSEDGVAQLRFEHALPAGQSVLEIQYDAPLDRQLHGLFRVDSGGDSYVFSQFEAISARAAFPSFDEPGWKTPFDIWLTVPEGDVAASNSKVVAEEHAGEHKRVHFAQTKPLPTYLVAFAVGPFDVVDAQPLAANALRSEPLPVRGLCPKGKGPLLARALAEVGPTINALESYFAIGYPYDKLDIVAVPDFGPGAMENAGLVTFRDWLLLLDPKHSGEAQRRASAFVLAHELAHQWFGDLVTMHYWEDIWLNEAFATWMEYRVVGQLHPEYGGELELRDDMEDAMQSDSRVSARMIRQPITSTHDIMNAFDSITYSKGGGVIGMFERYLGSDAFQQGVQAYLRTHAFGNASTEDLLAALSKSAGKDVTTPFLSFLTQVGVPLLDVQLTCTAGKAPELALHQSRYLPLGSNGDTRQSWQIPVCVRYESAGAVHERCSLLTEPTGTIALEGTECPSWYLPDAEGAGYYRYNLPSVDLEKLRSHGLPKLTVRERYSLARALEAGFAAGSVSASDLLKSLSAWASDRERAVAVVPMASLSLLHDLVVSITTRPAIEAFVRQLYLPAKNRLGLREQPGESGETKLFRSQVLRYLCERGNDEATRTRLARLGRQYLGIGADNQLHADALPHDLADLGVSMFVQTGGAPEFDAVYQRLRKTDDSNQRGQLLHALASVRDARSGRALELALDPALHVNEVMLPLRDQLADPQTRDAAYAWFERNFDALAKRLSPQAMGGSPWLAAAFCDQAMVGRIQQFFETRLTSLPGGPRSLAGVSETLQLCDALVKGQREGVEAFFKPH